MMRLRFVALGLLLTLVLSTAARSAPDVAPYPTPAGYKSVMTARTAKDATGTPAPAVAAGYLGVVVGDKGGRPVIEAVAPDSPAEQAGLKEGDAVLKLGDEPTTTAAWVRDALRSKLAGETLELTVSRGGGQVTVTAKLKATSLPMKPEEGGGGGKGGGWNDRIPRAWKKPTYNLAIIGVEYPDVKHNAKIKDCDWEESMFSLGTYTGKNATGQPVHGSMNDYYKELSYGTFKIEGKFVGWYEVSKKRTDYSSGSGTSMKEKTVLLTEALDSFTKQAGADALKAYDGVFFIYAGERVNTTRGGLYWPHRATVNYGNRGVPYFIVQEGGATMNDISVFCHEFGHMLGLPDLYARPEQPGSEGVGQWCAMSNQIGGGRPQHFCAWSKEVLGWVKPTVIDPSVKQKLIVAPIEDDPTQCFKIKVRPDNSEYFLLEVRKKTGWDEKLPGEGLLIWRVLNNRPILEESHGVEGARGPNVFLNAVPFPSSANNSFTPYTTPSSKSQLGGGVPVYITNITRLPDGRVTFHIGYDYQ
jgi:M6 family metalloprotease-like protein